MKVLLILLILVVLLSTISCGNSKVINGKKYDTYGLLNSDEYKDPKIKYRVIIGNVIWGALLFETIIAPVYFFGFSIFEPVELKET